MFLKFNSTYRSQVSYRYGPNNNKKKLFLKMKRYVPLNNSSLSIMTVCLKNVFICEKNMEVELYRGAKPLLISLYFHKEKSALVEQETCTPTIYRTIQSKSLNYYISSNTTVFPGAIIIPKTNHL